MRDLPCSEDVYHHDENERPAYDKSLTLNERPSPVGGESIEDEITVTETSINKPDSEDDWSDWDNTNRKLNKVEHVISPNDAHYDNEYENIDLPQTLNNAPITSKVNPTRLSLLQKAALEAKKNIMDISELDIKNQKIDSSKKSTDEFDFFADMMPVIEKPTVVNVVQNTLTDDLSSKLNFVPDHDDENEGWGDSWND